MPSFVDDTRHVQLVPTRHLTTIRQDVVLAEGHVYNDYFSIKFDPGELREMQRRHANFAETLESYPGEVLDALEEARARYAEKGFREMERIKAADRAIVPAAPPSADRPPWLGNETILVK